MTVRQGGFVQFQQAAEFTGFPDCAGQDFLP